MGGDFIKGRPLGMGGHRVTFSRVCLRMVGVFIKCETQGLMCPLGKCIHLMGEKWRLSLHFSAISIRGRCEACRMIFQVLESLHSIMKLGRQRRWKVGSFLRNFWGVFSGMDGLEWGTVIFWENVHNLCPRLLLMSCWSGPSLCEGKRAPFVEIKLMEKDFGFFVNV